MIPSVCYSPVYLLIVSLSFPDNRCPPNTSISSDQYNRSASLSEIFSAADYAAFRSCCCRYLSLALFVVGLFQCADSIDRDPQVLIDRTMEIAVPHTFKPSFRADGCWTKRNRP